MALIGGGIFFYLRSRRRSQQRHPALLLEKDGLPDYSTAASLGSAELLGTPHAAELSARRNDSGPDHKPGQPGPVEKDAGTVEGRYTSNRVNSPIEME